MKKLLAVLLVLAFVAPAMADDTLDVSGAFRVEYYDISNRRFTDTDYDFWDQRFRLQLKIKPADGITAVLRGDFAEGEWATDNMPEGDQYRADGDAGNGNVDEVLMIDKAYVQVKKSIVTVTAGLQGYTLGDAFGYCQQKPGLEIKIAPKPMTFRIGFNKISEGGSISDSTAAVDDVNHYYGDIGYKSKGFAVNLYGATQQDDNGATADEPQMIGVLVKAKAGPLNIKAFIENFGGDDGAGTDYTGLQFYADLSMKLGSMTKLGAELVYSDASDAGEDKIVRFPNAIADYRSYIDRGPAKGTVVLNLNTYNNDDDMFNMTGDAGALGGRVYADFKVMPVLTLSANLGYFVPDEDRTGLAGAQDSVLTYGGSVLWAMAPKTSLGVGYLSWNPDELNAGDSLETMSALYAIMKVKF